MTPSLWTQPRARLGLVLLGTLAAVSLLAPWLAPYDPAAQPDPVRLREIGPVLAHPFGTDGLSRDVLSRLLHGGRTSLGVALGAVVLATSLGTAWGLAAGYAGRGADAVLMRLVDAMMAVPRVLLAVVLVASTGPLQPWALALLLGGTGWFGTSRLVRAEVRALRRRPHILAARALGLTEWGIARRHILPAVLPVVGVSATLSLAATVPLEAGLSFLGLGVRPPTPSWGTILLDGADHPERTWWLVLFPGLAIALAVLAATLLGEGVRAHANPRGRRR